MQHLTDIQNQNGKVYENETQTVNESIMMKKTILTGENIKKMLSFNERD